MTRPFWDQTKGTNQLPATEREEHVCVCVCERERERQHVFALIYVYICVYLCEFCVYKGEEAPTDLP